MRPYWAVLKDSFREALASRVLVILLAISTLGLLLMVAPISMKPEPLPTTSAFDFNDPSRLVNDWLAQKDSSRATPGKHLWSLLNPEQQQQLAAWGEAPLPPAAATQLAQLLEGLLKRKDFYDAASWKGAEASRTATKLLEAGPDSLAPETLRRANRLLLEAAFRGQVAESHADALYFHYFGWNIGQSLNAPIEQHELEPVVQAILTSVMTLFVGRIGVFAAILVTSMFVPQMFEAGAVDLLFSKPVNRSLLFLTRFVGAGAFIALNAAYFIVGLWLITGLRFGVWSSRLMLCIPLFVFVFLVYYSISAAAGAVWRNAIVAVIMTVLFGLLCFGVDLANGLFEVYWAGPTRLVKLMPLDDGVMALDVRGDLLSWDAAATQWKAAERLTAQSAGPPGEPPGFRRPPIGPVYDARDRRLVNVESRSGELTEAREDTGWATTRLGSAPEGAASLLLNRAGDVLVVGRKGVFRLQGAEFEPISEESLSFTFPTAALDPTDDVITVYSRGRLYRLAPGAEGRYQLTAQRDLETPERGVIAAGDDTVLLALEKGRVLLLDGATLDTRHEQQPEPLIPPRFAYASHDGRYLAVLFHSKRLWIYQPGSKTLVEAPIGGQEDITAAAFAQDGSLLVADRGRRVRTYALPDGTLQDTLSPTLAGWDRAYYYVIRPLYNFFPIPGRIGETMNYLLSDRSTQQVGDDLSVAQVQVEVARPLVTNAVFMAIVLALTCWYVSRRDF